jgi:hypothetical protein
MEAGPLSMVMLALQPVGSQFGAARDTLVRDPSGEFELSGVAPGKYVLSANAADLTNRVPSAQLAIEVGETDLEGIQLTLAAPQTVRGLVVAPEGHRIPQELLVMLSNRVRTNRESGGLGQVSADGTFTVDGVPAADYDIELASVGPGDDLYISAIRKGDEDVLAKGLHVSGPSRDRIEIVLKAKGAAVDVVVRTPEGDPFPEASVALLPDPPRRAQVAFYGSCMTDARGICTLRGLAPGDYHVFAVAKDAGVDFFRDPDSTKDFEKQSKAIKVAEGDRQKVEIELKLDDQ